MDKGKRGAPAPHGAGQKNLSTIANQYLFHVVETGEECIIETAADVLAQLVELFTTHSGVPTETNVNVVKLPPSHLSCR